MSSTPAAEIARLRDEIRRHEHKYRVGSSEITDLEFDRLMDRLEWLEAEHPELLTPDSPTQRIGDKAMKKGPRVPHLVPMLSIDNTYSITELSAFGARTAKLLAGERVAWVVELKVDGVAVSLVYENGLLIRGLTRGDGGVGADQGGDDVTHNIRTIRDIPLRLLGPDVPRVLEARGEVYITNSDLVQYNELQQHKKESGDKQAELLKNPRNGAAGSIMLDEPWVCAERPLRFFCHSVGFREGMSARTHMEFLAEMRGYGLPLTPYVERFETFDAAVEHSERIIARLHELEFEIDGLVLKVDSFEQRERLGETPKFPRWVIAYKFEKYEATTRIKDIRVQVGKTGTITPVADLEPVEIAGTTVSRASLHNAEEIERKDVRPGDVVVVEKAGKIIPHVVRVETTERRGHLRRFVFPSDCPACGSKVVKDEGGVYIRCPNPECPAQIKERIRYFASRNAMDIEELGEKLIDKLVDEGLVRTYSDLYKLRTDELVKLEWNVTWGANRARNLVDAIQDSKDRGLARVLYGLAIPRLRGADAVSLAEAFHSMRAIVNADVDELATTGRLGPIIAQDVHECLHTRFTLWSIEELEKAGIRTTNVGSAPASLRRKKPVAWASDSAGKDIEKRIEHFGSAAAMAIKGLGGVSIKGLIGTGLVKGYADLYRLKPEQLESLERTIRMSQKEAEKLLKKIEESKDRGLSRLLTGISVRHVGPRVASILSQKFHSMQGLRNAQLDEIAIALSAGRRSKEQSARAAESKKKGSESRIIARSVFDFLHSTAGLHIVDGLAEVGVRMESAGGRAPQSLAGKTFVVTGTLSKYSRDKIQELIAQHGGRPTSSVSRSTDYLLAGESPGSKLAKARELGVAVITEEDFEKMLNL